MSSVTISPLIRQLSRDKVIQTEAWMRKNYFHALRVIPADKSPAKMDAGYSVAEGYQPPGPEDFRDGGWSIGCVLGPARHGPVDIDHDCAEAMFFGEKFLPTTPVVFGRPSKPRSHKFYVVKTDAQPTLQFRDPILKSQIIELRADGGNHTVMPGSIHESGELVAWDNGLMFPAGDCTEVLPEELIHAVRKVAIATLVVRHLWVRSQGSRNEICKCLSGMLYYFKWPLAEAEQFISAIMEYNGDDDRSRLQTLRSTYTKGDQGKKIAGANKLKDAAGSGSAPAVDKIKEWMGSTTVSALMEMNERFACVSLDGKFRVVDTDVRAGERPIFLAKDDFIDSYGNELIMGNEGKMVSKVRYWLNSPARRFYRRVEFLPGLTDDTVPEGVFNMWTGWAVEPDPTGSCNAWLELVYNVICGQDDRMYDWLMNWLAQMVQFPTKKSHTCPVIIGVPGAGKTMMCTYLSRFLGAAYLAVTKPEHIQGRFNSHLRYTLLLHSDEALYARDKKHRAVIKSLVTDERQMSEQKGIDATFVRSWVRLLLTSNYDHAAPAEEKDRRFTVINMGDRRIEMDLRDRVLEEMRTTGPSALLHLLLSMQVDGQLANTNIKNNDWTQNVLDHTDPIIGWWHERLQTGLLVPENLRWATRPSNQNWPLKVGLEALYRYFVEDMRTSARAWGVITKTAFSTKLNELTGGIRKKHMVQYYPPQDDDFPRWVRELPGAQKSILDLPTLENCRFAFERFMGNPIEWDNPELTIAEPEDGSSPDVPPPSY